MPSHTIWNKKEEGALTMAVLSCMLLLGGMVYSPYLQSLSMFFLGAAAVWHALAKKQRDHNREVALFAVVGLHFLIVLAGIFYPPEEPAYLLERLRIKAPFLMLPLVFWLLPAFPKHRYFQVWWFLLILLGITSLGIMANYLLHFEAINLKIRQGQPMPMPCNHIRYSLLQAMGIVGGLYLLEERTLQMGGSENRLQVFIVAGLVAWLFIAQHLIAVRSGLVVTYAVLMAAAIRYLFARKKYFAGGVVLLALALAPILAYRLVPSVRTRIGYMRYDFDLYRKGVSVGTLSDASRWVSWKIGWDIFRGSPWLGVGPGNLRKEVEARYAVQFPDFEKRLMPHNQFLHTAAGSGAIGLLVFLPAFFIPLFYRKNRAHFPLFALHLIVFLSFIVEATLENAMGVAFFLFFLLLGLNFQKGRPGVQTLPPA
jgi:O-antigen ligase